MNNSLISLLSRIFGIEVILKLLLGVVSILIARNFDEAEYSSIVFILLVINLSVNIAAGYFNRFIFITDNRKSFIQNKLNGEKSLLILFSVVLFFTIFGISEGEFSEFLLIGSIVVILRLSYTFTQSSLQFNQDFKKYYLNELLRTILYSLPALIYLEFADSPNARVILYLLLFSFFTLFLYNYLRRGTNLTYLISRRTLGRFRLDMLGFLVFLSFISSLDILVIESYENDNDLSNYGAAVTIYSFLILALSSIHKILLPKISSGNKKDIKRNLRELNKINVVLIGAYFICLPFSKEIFVVLYGLNKYEDAHAIFNILALSALFSFILSPYINVLNRLGDFRSLLQYSAFVMLFMIPAHFLGYRFYGTIGVACTTLFGNFTFNLLVTLRARRRLDLLDR